MATTALEIRHNFMHRVAVYRWILTDDETGDFIVVPIYADVSVQAFGTWTGGATLTFEGNNIPSNVSDFWFQARNPIHDLISLTANGGDHILPNYFNMRPKITGGASSSVTIYMLLKL